MLVSSSNYWGHYTCGFRPCRGNKLSYTAKASSRGRSFIFKNSYLKNRKAYSVVNNIKLLYNSNVKTHRSCISRTVQYYHTFKSSAKQLTTSSVTNATYSISVYTCGTDNEKSKLRS